MAELGGGRHKEAPSSDHLGYIVPGQVLGNRVIFGERGIILLTLPSDPGRGVSGLGHDRENFSQWC